MVVQPVADVGNRLWGLLADVSILDASAGWLDDAPGAAHICLCALWLRFCTWLGAPLARLILDDSAWRLELLPLHVLPACVWPCWMRKFMLFVGLIHCLAMCVLDSIPVSQIR